MEPDLEYTVNVTCSLPGCFEIRELIAERLEIAYGVKAKGPLCP